MRRADVDISTRNVDPSEGAGAPGTYEGHGSGVPIRPEQPLDEADNKAAERGGTNPRNEALLEGYLSGRRLAPGTRGVYRNALESFDRIVGAPLEEAGARDLGAWYRGAVASGLAASSIALYATRLRELLRHALTRRGLTREEAREATREIMAPVPMDDLRREARRSVKGREALVTPGELEALLGAAEHPRTRALIAVLHESACRKGELLGLRVRDVVDAGTHVELRVLGKTGERTVPLVSSRRHLEAWLAEHPDPRPSAPLFATLVGGAARRLHPNTPNKLLKDLCRRAGVRHVTPHMLRHTRLTELARAGVGEFVLKSFAGWTSGSRMAERYVHLSGRAHVPAILRLEGVRPEEVGAS